MGPYLAMANMTLGTIPSSGLFYLTLGQLLIERPARLAVFERFGLDCFCGGRVPLARACAALGVDPTTVADALSAVNGHDAVRTLHAALDQVIRHLEESHHATMRRDMLRCKALLERAVEKQGTQHPQWASVLAAYADWAEHMDEHMKEEEDGVFAPCRAIIEGRRAELKPGALADSVRAMLDEHGAGGNETEQLRAATRDYAVPPDACDEYRDAMTALQAMEADLHRHMHEENMILFPMALAAQ
jgi:regulator of cell morphogenesis and NO signaling